MSFFDSLKNIFFNKTYYFDNNATTFIYDGKTNEIVDEWISCANPSNTLHTCGLRAHNQVSKCHELVAKDLGVNRDEIYFTASATEANNIVIQGIINKNLQIYNNITIVTSVFEHPSVFNIFKKFMENPRINVIFVPLDLDPNSNFYGSVDINYLFNILKSVNNIVLVSIMYANNETGAINDIEDIGYEIYKINKQQSRPYIFFHSDCTQMIGKQIIKPKHLYIDSITFSGHKFHAPKGIGCLYVSKNKKCSISGLCYGGEQEESIRPGTENVAYISALTYALYKVHENRKDKNAKLENMKKYILKRLKKMNCIPILPRQSLNNTILFILPKLNICNQQFCNLISKKYNICLGTSSACQTNKISHVLLAMGIEKDYRTRIIRLSMSDYTTEEECEYLLDKLKLMINEHKNIKY